MLAHACAVASARDLVNDAIGRLGAAGVAEARLDAELLMAEACGLSRAEVLAGLHSPDAEAVARFEKMIARRTAREPLAYIVGHREFYALDLRVNPAVLIPRPETETAVDAALAFIAQRPEARVLDLGTGSGCIALAIAGNAPRARMVATDISETALEVARGNAKLLGLSSRVEFVCGDLFEPVSGIKFDLVVSNPPYVEDSERLAREIRDFEPGIALYAGADGLRFYRRIAESIRSRLESDGSVIVEVGAAQAEAVASLFLSAGAIDTQVLRDLAGIPRVVAARFA